MWIYNKNKKKMKNWREDLFSKEGRLTARKIRDSFLSFVIVINWKLKAAAGYGRHKRK